MPAMRTRRPVQPRLDQASKVFLLWEDPSSRRWLPVGQLTRDGEEFRFVYTKGAEESKRFQPFGRMTDLNAVYVGHELFPLFANRLLPKSRPEYRDFLSWLGVDEAAADELELLWRSGGERATDTLQVVPCPEPSSDGQYRVEFFSHGIRHLPPEARERIARLEPGQRLYLMQDVQNPRDHMALMLRTGDPINVLGYCPRFYSGEFSRLLELSDPDQVVVTVAAVNPSAPLQFRLRCQLTSPWPSSFVPCAQEAFKPLC
jgi:hypothetical protein